MMRSPWAQKTGVIVLGWCLASCATNARPVPEAEYSSAIVGRWQGTVGDLKETLTLNGDGTFVGELRTTGFIANTLSQSENGTIRGTWRIIGTTITFRITGAQNERLRNVIASTTIMAFKVDTLVLKSDRGETSTFRRAWVL